MIGEQQQLIAVLAKRLDALEQERRRRAAIETGYSNTSRGPASSGAGG